MEPFDKLRASAERNIFLPLTNQRLRRNKETFVDSIAKPEVRLLALEEQDKSRTSIRV
ncbi:MAG: hypothetical protein QME52_11960 [Bacteroidota bacterium]|nr:hypothetical protein [Bacteroidota bacterium]